MEYPELEIIFPDDLLDDIRNAADGSPLSDTYIQVLYDKSSHKVLGDFHFGGNWSAYHDKNVVSVGNFWGDVTQAELELAIRQAVWENDVFAGDMWP